MVVGAGIVGLATARAIRARRPRATVAVIDKEPRVAAHQSGHNSGVIHAGVYYAPGSAKARLCREGRFALIRFCADHDLPFAVGGKLIVATDETELGRLGVLERRATANGLEVRRLSPDEVREHEPHARAVAALRVPATGIVDFAVVARALATDLHADGVEVHLGNAVTAIHERADGVTVETTTDHGAAGEIRAAALVNCGGLQSDRLAAMVAAGPDGGGPLPRIFPFRGEYHDLRPERRFLVKGLIYPVPDPDLPFLGVHLTRGIHGEVHAGPNAVPALGREAYRWRTVEPRHVREVLAAASTYRLARRWWRTEAGEIIRSIDRSRFVTALQRLVPAIEADDLVPAPAGIRAQAVAADGTLLDDFVFATTARTLHVLNAPSPAATASLAIGHEIAGRLDAMAPRR